MRGKEAETIGTCRSFVLLIGTQRNSSWGSGRWVDWFIQEIRQRARQEVLCQTKEQTQHVVWHRCADNILWEERKVTRNLPLALLLHPPLPLSLGFSCEQLWSIRIPYCKIIFLASLSYICGNLKSLSALWSTEGLKTQPLPGDTRQSSPQQK